VQKAIQTIRIEIASEFSDVVPAALTRIAYLFPDLSIEQTGGSLKIIAPTELDLGTIRKEIHYLLYREKIRADFAPFRKLAFDRLFGAGK